MVTFFSRDYGKLHGVARHRAGDLPFRRSPGDLHPRRAGLLRRRAERPRPGRPLRRDAPFAALREDLGRLGQAAWVVECVARPTGERDPQPAVYGLLVRALSVHRTEASRRARGRRGFGIRCVDALGHRLRLDRCVACGAPTRSGPALDVAGWSARCARARGVDARPRSPPAGLAALRRLRACSWAEATPPRSVRPRAELRADARRPLARLIGQPDADAAVF